ncbi:hypothetical protein QCA50_016642 [Cerrena zonata]|uniref:Enoyl reductase (ER) domain-containing protein n=1 Tax=Cerrena zonata TaxID=2478898 RepID=A0AAW0FM70_9APHY
MPVVTNGRVVYVEHPVGSELYQPEKHSKYVEEQIDTDTVPLNGGVLIKVLAISSDPYMRHRMRDDDLPLFCPPLIKGELIDNFSVGKIIRSENPEFAPGDYVIGYFSFENYHVYPSGVTNAFKHCIKVPKIPGLPLSAFVGVLGLAGRTAYTGWQLYGQEKAKTSKTLFISGGAGAVGTCLIELVKTLHPDLKIIASAGTQQKIDLLKSLGVDVAFNYKEDDAVKVLAENGPIDIYWDNTSGYQTDAALQNINMHGVIIACGAIAGLNDEEKGVVRHFEKIFERSVHVYGFLFRTGEDSEKAFHAFDKEVIPLIVQGKIQNREHRFIGLQNAGKALQSVHTGENFGKAVIIVDPEGGEA